MVICSRNSYRLLLAFIALNLLSGCLFTEDRDHMRVSVVDDQERQINPIGIRLDYGSATMRAAITKGLVGLDEQGRVVPALAARWIVTDDGLSYIFRIYEARWDDGRKITADQIAKLLRERFKELGRGRLGEDIQAIDEVISMTGRVIEIRLKSPHPNFLQLLAQPEMGLFRGSHGAGPLRREKVNQGIRLRRFENAAREEEDDPAADERWVSLRNERAALAISRFAKGHGDVVLGGKFQHLPLLEAAGISTGDIRLDPVAGLFGLLFVHAEGFWSVPKNREILSMAINRPALLTSFPSVTAWQSRQKIIPEALDVEGINSRPDWAPMTMEARVEFTRDHVARWQASEGPIKPLAISLPEAAGAEILFIKVRADMRRIGLDLVKAKPKDADVLLIDEIAPYDSPQWFLSRLTCDRTAVCLNDADSKIADAEEVDNLITKARLYAEAEQLLVPYYNFIPIAVPLRWSLVRAGQRGFAVNPRGWHPLNSLIGIPIS